ncbi:MAG: TolC family protein [Fibrobacteres bacterium]|nr:TolC family protein [Fibrobacterota bacterium]
MLRFPSLSLSACALAAICAGASEPETPIPAAAIPMAAGPADDPLPALVSEAMRNNPSIQAAEYQVKALRSAPDHAWSWEAPQVGVEFFQTPVKSFPNPIKNQQEIDYSVQQAFPFPGKIATRIRAEDRRVDMGSAELEALKHQVARDVKTDYYELYLLDRRMEINSESQALMRRLIEIARRQYEVGMGRQADILKAQTELTSLRTDSIGLEQMRRATAGMLNALLNRETERPFPVAADLKVAEIGWTFGQIAVILEENHPKLRSMQASIRMREAEKSMAGKEYLPEFMVRGTYKDMLAMSSGEGSPGDFWSVMVSMNVPVAFWSLPRYRAGYAQGEANLAQAKREYANMRNMLFAKAQEALLKAESGAELARLAKSVLVPQAQQALESNQAAYQGGKGDFMTLLDAYRTRLMAKENAEMAIMQLSASQADLEEAVGLGLEEISLKISEGAKK